MIRFHEGVTAIVGPNGSGKSNVTDAIRWVLGEQSMKTLRTSKMEELIFSGTQTRRPLSYAEVTLTMDNSDRSLPLDYPEIRVSRRIYRSGESEYLINDSRCRLKDINELFLDTGIGRDGYSMIGQGRVDDILSGKAELRRKMLDEASGITKYKIRRDEAEKKLAKTEQNLIRLNDIMQVIEKQKGPLERQAKKAKTFLKLHEELKASDLALLYYDIDRKEAENKRLKNDLEELNRNLEDAEKQKTQIMEAAAHYREASQAAAATISQLQSDEASARSDMNRHEQNLALAVQQIEQITSRRERYIIQGNELQSRLEKLEEEEKSKSEDFAELDRLEQEAKEELRLAEEKYREAQRSLQTNMLLQQTLDEDEKKQQEHLEDIRQRIQNELTNQEILKTHMEMLDRDLADLSTELNSGESEVNRLAESLEKNKARLAELNEQNRLMESAREKRRLLLAEGEQELRRLENRAENLRYQYKTQQELAESYEGYSYSVKQLMEAVKDKDPDILGPVADLLTVPEKYEAAIESILGGTAQHIVVKTDDSARRMINMLKSRRWGRATFLPLNQVKPSRPQEQALRTVSRMKGYLGTADELVSFDPEAEAAVRYALGRTVVADTLDNALEMARACGFRIRLSSLDGDLLNPGGSMSGGSRKQQSSGILSRKRQLDQLEEAIEQTEKAASEKKAELEKTRKAAEEAEGEIGRCSQEIANLSREEILLNSHLNQYEQSRIRLRSKHEQNRADYERFLKEQAEGEASAAKEKEKEAEALELLEQTYQQKQNLQSKLEEQNAALTEAAEQKNALNLKMMQSRERGATAKQLLSRVRQELLQIRDELAAQDLDKQRDEAETEKLSSFISEGTANKKKLADALASVQEKLKAAESRQQEAGEALAQSSEELASVSSHLTKLGQEQGRLEQRCENASRQLLELRGRLWEDYACTFANKEEWAKEDLDPASARESVKNLRREIKALGSVNVQAIEESKEVNERFDFMNKQREDILAAQKDLEKIIAEIVDGMQEQFRSSFRFINEQFNLVFQQLFGGGEAELVLEDKKDILNSNIDIKVSPPGKRLQNMLALSGGERCLTAIALLFAIQKLNPSPFCVLDEVEAALDEANVFRFTDYINANSDKTQYILVTHRRGTMEAARMIYGVTMQERGVSQIISVRLDEDK